MLAISDVNSAGRPPSYGFPTDPVTHQPRPFLFSDHKAPDPVSLSFIPPSRSSHVQFQFKTFPFLTNLRFRTGIPSSRKYGNSDLSRRTRSNRNREFLGAQPIALRTVFVPSSLIYLTSFTEGNTRKHLLFYFGTGLPSLYHRGSESFDFHRQPGPITDLRPQSHIQLPNS